MDVIVEEADKEYADWEDFEDYAEDGGWDMSGSQDKKPIIEVGDLYLFAYHKKADKDTEIVCAKLSEVSEAEKLVTFVDEDDKEYLFEYTVENERQVVVTENDVYKITEMYLVEPFDPDKDEYHRVDDEIHIIADVRTDKVYSDYLKSDDLLSSLIQSLGIYDKPARLRQTMDTVATLLTLSKIVGPPELSDKLSLQLRSLPSGVYPVTDSQLKEVDDTGLMAELQDEEKGTYIETLRQIYSHQNPLDNENTDMKRVSGYSGRYFRDTDGTLIDGRGFKDLALPTDEGDLRTVEDPQMISFAGLLIEPLLDYKLSSYPSMYLNERIYCDTIHTTNQITLRHYLKDLPILYTDINAENPEILSADDYQVANADGSVNEALHTISDKLPPLIDIIQTLTEDHIIYKHLHNVHDINALIRKYKLTYTQLPRDIRDGLRKILEQNTGTAMTSLKSSKEIQIRDISVQTRIKLSLQYILSLQDIKTKQFYLTQFIENFTREADKSHESSLWLYNKYTEQPILCSHYRAFVKATNENDVYREMRSMYGMPCENGSVVCKVCGETWENEQDADPDNLNQTLESNEDEEYLKELAEFIESKSDIVMLLKSMGTSFGTEIPDEMVRDIWNTYRYVNHDDLADARYTLTDVTTTDIHPYISASFETLTEAEQKALKSEKSKSKRSLLKKEYKAKRKKVLDEFNEWIVSSNRLLAMLSILLLMIQTTVPAPSLKRNYILRLVDTKHKKIDKKSLKYVLLKFQKLYHNYAESPLWKCAKQLFEGSSDANDIETQVENTLIYLLTPNFPTISERFTLYETYVDSDKHEYVRPEWVTYKPLAENSLLTDISTNLTKVTSEDQLKKLYSGYPIENISLIRTTHQSLETSVASECKIPVLHILLNESFKKIFRFVVTCYGKHNNNPLFSLLVNDLLQTTDQPEKLKAIFRKHGYSETDGMFGAKTLDFKVLREKVIPEILSVYSGNEGSHQLRSCYDNESSCNYLIHTNINAYDLHLLNTYPKRIYTYQSLSPYPDLPYNRLQETHPDLIQKLLNSYQYNVVHEFVRKPRETTPYDRYGDLVDDDDLPEMSSKKLKDDEDTFYKLLRHKQLLGNLPYHAIKKPLLTYTTSDYEEITHQLSHDTRFLSWLTEYPEDMNEEQQIHLALREYWETYLSDILEDKPIKDIRVLRSETKQLFSLVMKDTQTLTRRLAGFYAQNPDLDDRTKKRLIAVFRDTDGKPSLTTGNLETILQNFLDTPSLTYDTLKVYCDDIHRLLVQLSSQRISDRVTKYDMNTKSGVTSIKSRWKMSDTMSDNLHKFMIRDNLDELRDTYDMLLHNRVFALQGKDYYSGFQSYERTSENSRVYFEGLLQSVEPYCKDLELLKASTESLYSEAYSQIYMKYHLMVLLTKIGDFIEGLRDEESEAVQDANELFLSLDQSYEDSRRDCIKVCTQFMMDLLTHILHTHYDPMWLSMNEDEDALQRRISKSKEAEKQQLITKIDSKSQDDRYIMMARQKMGISNFFKELSESKIKLVQSKEYTEASEQERRDMLEETNETARLMIDVLNEDLNPNDPHLTIDDIPVINAPLNETVSEEEGEEPYVEMDDEMGDDEDDNMDDADFDQEFNE